MSEKTNNVLIRENKMKQKISSYSMAVLLICGAASFLRMLFFGRGLLTYVLAASAILILLSIIQLNGFLTVKMKTFQFLLIALLIIHAISEFFLPSGMVSLELENMKVQICSVILFLYLLNSKETKVLVVLSFIVAGIFIYCYLFSYEYYLGGDRIYLKLQENVYLDPNMTIASFIVPSVVAVKMIVDRSALYSKLFAVTFLLISFYCAFLGASRGGLLAIVIGVCFFLVVSYRPNSRTIFMYFTLGIAGIIMVPLVLQYVSPELLERMTLEDVLESGGSGRFEIYAKHINTFFEDSSFLEMVFGHGKESCKLLLGISSHNIIIDFLWDIGLVGVSIYFAATGGVFIYCYHCKSKIGGAIVIAAVAWSMTISAGNQLIYWVTIYTGVCIAKNERNFFQ